LSFKLQSTNQWRQFFHEGIICQNGTGVRGKEAKW
jgi:hypothetical protein